MITQNCTNLLNTIQNDDYKEFENTIRNNAQILIFKCLIVNQNRNKTKHSTFKTQNSDERMSTNFILSEFSNHFCVTFAHRFVR